MAKIIIIGLVGYNLGDEAIAVAVNTFLSKENTVSITTVSPGALAKYGIKEIYLNRRSLDSVLNLIRNIKNSDIVLIGGGSLVQDKLGVGLYSGVLAFFLQTVILAKLLGKTVITLPIGIDELDTRLGKLFAKCALIMIDELYVRDEQSKKLALRYVNKILAVNVSADPAILLASQHQILMPAPELNATKQKRVVISLVKENLETPGLVESTSLVCKALIATGCQVLLLAMDSRPDDEIELYQKILEKVPGVEIFLPKNIYDVIDCLSHSDALVAMRLHAMILGINLLPIIGISRTTKTNSFCLNFGIPFFAYETEWAPQILELIDEMCCHRAQYLAKQINRSIIETAKAQEFSDYLLSTAKNFNTY